MYIRIQCIHKCKQLQKQFVNDANSFCEINNDMITCTFVNPINTQIFRLQECRMVLSDVLMLSETMDSGKEYDCVLEIDSFKVVDIYTNHSNSIRGYFFNSVPEKYLNKYRLYKEQQCLEINGDILLISPDNNSLLKTIENNTLIEIIPQSPLRLRSYIQIL